MGDLRGLDIVLQRFDLLIIGLILLTSFLFSALIIPRLSHIAERIGLIDTPTGRKIHKRPKPLVGGLGMIMSLSLTSLLFFPLSNMRGFYSGLIILTIIGFLDDHKEVNHYWKFFAQAIAAACIILLNNNVLLSFGDLFSTGEIKLGIFAIPITIFCTIGVINSINMIDGLDGLAGGISLIAFVSFAVLSYLNNQVELMALSLALSGVVMGFLLYNWPPSKLFMGDAGSLSLGFSLAFLSIAITQGKGSVIPPVVPLLILAVPVIDAVIVMAERVFRGESPFCADKTHIHHRLIDSGIDKKKTLYIILGIAFLLNIIAVTGTILKIHDYLLFMIFGAYFLISLSVRLQRKNWLEKRRHICGIRE